MFDDGQTTEIPSGTPTDDITIANDCAIRGSRGGAMVRALTPHQCGVGSILVQCHMWVLHLGLTPAVVVKLVCLNDPESCSSGDFDPWQVYLCRIGRRVEARQRTDPGPPGWGLGNSLPENVIYYRNQNQNYHCTLSGSKGERC